MILLVTKRKKRRRKKRSEARNEGQVPKSQEVNSALVLLAGVVGIISSIGWMSRGLKQIGNHFFWKYGQHSIG